MDALASSAGSQLAKARKRILASDGQEGVCICAALALSWRGAGLLASPRRVLKGTHPLSPRAFIAPLAGKRVGKVEHYSHVIAFPLHSLSPACPRKPVLPRASVGTGERTAGELKPRPLHVRQLPERRLNMTPACRAPPGHCSCRAATHKAGAGGDLNPRRASEQGDQLGLRRAGETSSLRLLGWRRTASRGRCGRSAVALPLKVAAFHRSSLLPMDGGRSEASGTER
ncbi:hypothetical protein SKAU_G00309870 [Synaphobranchus kaupii]|uniref:Uncharacterized protein n=1 Tax=Synaphobranchus kaupii TaxID=118154 RepID=A0A9Q1ERG0_SYNKA|nr:hypothetical protein SKAU_G00309870 [Synaphobranchus kaupii]